MIAEYGKSEETTAIINYFDYPECIKPYVE